MQVEALLLKEGNHLVHHTIHTYSDRNFSVKAFMHVHSVCISNAYLNLVTSQTTIVIAIDIQPKFMLFAQCMWPFVLCMWFVTLPQDYASTRKFSHELVGVSVLCVCMHTELPL